jgi:hypothetical protein
MFSIQPELIAQIRQQQQQLQQLRWQRQQLSQQLRAQWQQPALCVLAAATVLWFLLRPQSATLVMSEPNSHTAASNTNANATATATATATKVSPQDQRLTPSQSWWPALMMFIKFSQLLLLFSPAPSSATAATVKAKPTPASSRR